MIQPKSRPKYYAVGLFTYILPINIHIKSSLKPPAEIQEPYKTIINRIIDEWNKMESQELGEEDKAMVRNHPLYRKLWPLYKPSQKKVSFWCVYHMFPRNSTSIIDIGD